MTTKPVSGGRIKAANAPTPYLVSAQASGGLTVTTTTPADIPGATITITTANPNASVMVTGVFDTAVVTGGASVASGTCVVDGATQNGIAPLQLVTVGLRASVPQVWNVTLPTAGNHTIKLQGALSAAAGQATYQTTHTTITALVLDW